MDEEEKAFLEKYFSGNTSRSKGSGSGRLPDNHITAEMLIKKKERLTSV